MNKIFTFSLALFIGSVNVAFSASNQLPADLMYLDKPIDALCFSESPEKGNTIDLRNCGIEKEKYKAKGQTESLIKKGFIGFDWQDTHDPSYQAQGFSYYKAFDAGQQHYWIYSINNTGGTGEFTAITKVKRTDANTLSFKNLIGGDRCNGGVQDVSEKDHQLTFSVNLTAFDMLPLANDNPHDLQAYSDLASCAVCCTAKAFFQVNSDEKLTLKYVELNKISKTEVLPDQGKYQACFNKIYTSYVTKGETKLDEAKLKKLVKEFNKTCV